MGGCWICGDAAHAWPICPKRKGTGCVSCGGSCGNVKRCPQSWYFQQRKGTTTTTPSTDRPRPQPTASVARTATVLDLTQEVKQVGTLAHQEDILRANTDPHEAAMLSLSLRAGTRGCPLAAVGERSLEGLASLMAIVTPPEQRSPPPALPPLLSLSSRDMVLPFSCRGQRALALVDTGASTSYVCPSFLALIGVAPLRPDLSQSIRLADGSVHVSRGYAVLEIMISKKWPILKIRAIPLGQGGQPLLLGADWAQRLGIQIAWPGPVLQPNHVEHCSTAELSADSTSGEIPPRIQVLLDKWAGVFTPPGRVPADVPFQHTILIEEGAKPFRSPPYRMTADQLSDLRSEIEGYLDNQWVRPSQSPWGSPITYVPKKDNTRRLVFDYRRLNKVTLPDASPLPRIDDLLATVARAKIFSKIDLKQGYNQIPMAREAIPLTAFVTPIPIRGANHFEWTVLPFGLMNAPPTFQRVMHHVMQGAEHFTAVYMDDILIHSTSIEEHIEHVAWVLGTLSQARLHAKASKCEWMRGEVEFLGHKLARGKVHITPLHEEAIKR